MSEVMLVRDFDPDAFHARILELERQGWIANRESYRIIAEMNPEDGKIIHLHSIEMSKP